MLHYDERLRELGYVDGQNLVLDFLNPDAYAGGIADAMKELFAESRCHHCTLRERGESRTCRHRYGADSDDCNRL